MFNSLRAVKLFYSKVELLKLQLSAMGIFYGFTSHWVVNLTTRYLLLSYAPVKITLSIFFSLQLVERVYSEHQASFLGSMSFLCPFLKSPAIFQCNYWYVNTETAQNVLILLTA